MVNSNGIVMMSLCLTVVLKKSQKETSSLIQRNSKEEPTDVEFDVMGQWTSLFLNMNDILAREGSRLVSSSRGFY